MLFFYIFFSILLKTWSFDVFVSVQGTGKDCSEKTPCNITQAFSSFGENKDVVVHLIDEGTFDLVDNNYELDCNLEIVGVGKGSKFSYSGSDTSPLFHFTKIDSSFKLTSLTVTGVTKRNLINSTNLDEFEFSVQDVTFTGGSAGLFSPDSNSLSFLYLTNVELSNWFSGFMKIDISVSKENLLHCHLVNCFFTKTQYLSPINIRSDFNVESTVKGLRVLDVKPAYEPGCGVGFRTNGAIDVSVSNSTFINSGEVPLNFKSESRINISIDSCTFLKTYGYFGGSLWVVGDVEGTNGVDVSISIQNSIFNETYGTTENGGSMNIQTDGVIHYSSRNNTFYGNYGRFEGGMAYMSCGSKTSELSTMELLGDHYESNYGNRGPGGVFSIASTTAKFSLKIDDCTFLNNHAGLPGFEQGYFNGGVFYINTYDLEISGNRNLFKGNIGALGGVFYIAQLMSTLSLDFAWSNFYFNRAYDVDCETYCSTGDGGVFWVMNTMNDDPLAVDIGFSHNKFFSNNAIRDGGVLHIFHDYNHPDHLAQISLDTNYFFNNSANGKGGSLSLFSTSSNAIVANTFEQNYALSKGGAIYWENGADVSIYSRNTFTKNSVFMDADPNDVVGGLGGSIFMTGVNNVSFIDEDNQDPTVITESTAQGGGGIYFQSIVGNINFGKLALSVKNCEARLGSGIVFENSNNFADFSSDNEANTDNLVEVLANSASYNGGGLYFILNDEEEIDTINEETEKIQSFVTHETQEKALKTNTPNDYAGDPVSFSVEDRNKKVTCDVKIISNQNYWSCSFPEGLIKFEDAFGLPFLRKEQQSLLSTNFNVYFYSDDGKEGMFKWNFDTYTPAKIELEFLPQMDKMRNAKGNVLSLFVFNNKNDTISFDFHPNEQKSDQNSKDAWIALVIVLVAMCLILLLIIVSGIICLGVQVFMKIWKATSEEENEEEYDPLINENSNERKKNLQEEEEKEEEKPKNEKQTTEDDVVIEVKEETPKKNDYDTFDS